MAAFVATVRDTMLDWLTGKTTPAAVATRYITTYNGDPQGAGSENIATLTGSSNRINLTTAMAAASSGSAVSNADITFTASASGGATVDYVAIYSAITGGTLYASASVTSKTLSIGDSLKIPSGSLTLNIT
jgi:hypothetical protein